MPLVRSALAVAAGYLLGTFPTADLASRLVGGGDLRTRGTNNPGAANVIGLHGPRWGVPVAVVDVGKGWAAAALGQRVGPRTAHLAATAAVVGHVLPVWSGLRGGKGAATSYGAVLGTFPAYAVPDAAIALVASRATSDEVRAIEVGSVAWTAAAVLWWRRGLPNLWGPAPTWSLPAHAAVTSALVCWRFRRAAAAAAAAQSSGTKTAPTVPSPVWTTIDGPTT
jgi:glycerol-3-phosphate acyltransferase PlsY